MGIEQDRRDDQREWEMRQAALSPQERERQRQKEQEAVAKIRAEKASHCIWSDLELREAAERSGFYPGNFERYRVLGKGSPSEQIAWERLREFALTVCAHELRSGEGNAYEAQALDAQLHPRDPMTQTIELNAFAAEIRMARSPLARAIERAPLEGGAQARAIRAKKMGFESANEAWVCLVKGLSLSRPEIVAETMASLTRDQVQGLGARALAHAVVFGHCAQKPHASACAQEMLDAGFDPSWGQTVFGGLSAIEWLSDPKSKGHAAGSAMLKTLQVGFERLAIAAAAPMPKARKGAPAPRSRRL